MRTKRAKLAVETIQFRPGKRLGDLIEKLAKTWKTSHGETTKRLAALAAHELDVSFAPAVVELASFLDGKEPFEEACEMVYGSLHDEKLPHMSGPIPRSEQLRLVQGGAKVFGRLCVLETEA